ncbi:MAG: ribosome maturation factor RimM [Anaerolineae bacterium]|nr:ribosome maturation factor RimM [Anaerolineae bacterium]
MAARRKNKNSGLPIQGKPEFLAVGKLHRTHGLRGELFMSLQTDFPERIKPGTRLYLGSEKKPGEVASCRPYKKGLLVSFKEHATVEDAGMLRNQLVFVRSDDRPPLPEGEYYHHQLLGLRVVSENGEDLGFLAEILETGANDVYIVRPESGVELLLPAIDDVVLEIDLDQGVMKVHVLEGLQPGDK